MKVFEKGELRTLKKKNNNWVPLPKCVFWAFQAKKSFPNVGCIKCPEKSLLVFVSFFAPNVLFVYMYFEGPKAPILERWSAQVSDTSLRVPFFKKTFFLNLNKMCQKHIPIRGIQPPLVLLDYPSALLS